MNRAQTQYVLDRELIERYAEKFKAFGQLPFQKEVGDRLDGKPAQQVQLQGDADAPLKIIHESK